MVAVVTWSTEDGGDGGLTRVNGSGRKGGGR